MYRAKELGRGRAMFFDLNMTGKPSARHGDRPASRAAPSRVLAVLSAAVRGVAMAASQVVEALLRWQTPSDGMRYPSEFVPVQHTQLSQ